MGNWTRGLVCFVSLSLLLIALVQCGQPAVEVPPPPETKVEVVTDTLHGVEIADPYRWLEDQESPETRAWIDEQNAYTDKIMAQLPGQEELRATITKLMNIDEMSIPQERGGRVFYSRRDAGQDLWISYWREGFDGEEQVLIDPHPLSEDHTTSAGLRGLTPDGTLATIAIRKGGVDEVDVIFRDVATGEDLPDTLGTALYYSIAVLPDKSGMYFVRRDPEGPRLYYRDMGAEPGSEQLIFGEDVEARYFIGAEVTDDGHYLLIDIGYGWTRSDVYIKDLVADGPIEPVAVGVNALFAGFYEDGKFYIHTNLDAPNYKLMVVDAAKPEIENWTELIPERESAVLQFVSPAGGKLFASYLENVQSRIVAFDTGGNELGEIAFEGIGSVGGMVGNWESNTAFFSFQSFNVPFTIYRYNTDTGEQEEWYKEEVPFDGSKYEVKQVWYESKDGTKIPMFITHAKGIELDGSHPVFLTAYGGFGASMTPGFSAQAAVWLEHGGIYAEPNLRGGGEFGEAWHEAGKLDKKQNVFDDFIAAAEYLIDNGYTKPEKLAIRGGSNGGLLVTAMLTQRPDLYGAIICTYPLIDMVRYHMFLLGSTWISEYGSADDPEQFPYILEYSPYQHVKKGEKYPAVLFITGDGDTRVAPLHARKMTALVQASTGSDKPVMLRYHTKAGHSGGQPISEQIDNMVETLSFLFWQLGMNN